MKQLDEKFSEFENAAIQRENDYKQIIEQQRLDSEQLRSFEKLKESNLEMRSVRKQKFEVESKINVCEFLENSKAPGKLPNLRQSQQDAHKAVTVFWKGKSIANLCWTSPRSIRTKPESDFKAEKLSRQHIMNLLIIFVLETFFHMKPFELI